MTEKTEYNVMVFRNLKKLSRSQINTMLHLKITLLTVGCILAILAATAYATQGISSSPGLLLLLWSVLLIFHNRLTQAAYQLGVAFLFMMTLLAKSMQNIFFDEEIFGYLKNYLYIGSTVNVLILLFIFYNIIKSTGAGELFGLFAPTLRHLLRYKKARFPKNRK